MATAKKKVVAKKEISPDWFIGVQIGMAIQSMVGNSWHEDIYKECQRILKKNGLTPITQNNHRMLHWEVRIIDILDKLDVEKKPKAKAKKAVKK